MLVFAFSGAMFTSALIMFLIQPLIGKALLPKLGGTPQVWNTCMVFFQAVLFAGYLYAHFSGVCLGLRRQAALHIGVASLALLTLPLALSTSTGIPDTAHPVLWLLPVLAITVGGPLFVISATAPLLQNWFAHTRHPSAHDPYFMYGASNLGSLLALLSYPTVVERYLDLSHQAWLWSVGFAVLVALLSGCFLLFSRDCVKVSTTAESEAPSTQPLPVTPLVRLKWLILSFVPSSLLLGVTTYLTTDVAALPLFWIAPLALYLLTFVIVFARRVRVPHEWVVRAHAVLLTLVVVLMLKPLMPWPGLFVAHLAAFFVTALVCHGELVRCRPATKHLTEFYLWISLGGMLGGMFNALVAPVLFADLLEYPLMLALACLLRPRASTSSTHQRALDLVVPLAYGAMLLLAIRGIESMETEFHGWRTAGMVAVLFGAGLAMISFSDRCIRFGLGIVATFASLPALSSIGILSEGPSKQVVFSERSFFGMHKVYRDEDLGFTILMHGSTIHGAQSLEPQKALQPVAYYHANGPFADLFAVVNERLQNKPVAIVGLGAGGLACYGTRGSSWTYYEIDPTVERIARDQRYFTFLRDCPPSVRVVIGDARLTLRDAPDSNYGLIVVDAFSSDAIPTHLLTREALAGYMQKLAPDGVLALHISNRHMDLAPVVANLAAEAKLVGRLSQFPLPDSQGKKLEASEAVLAVLSRRESDLGQIASSGSWVALPRQPQTRVWSDDYINILAALKRAP